MPNARPRRAGLGADAAQADDAQRAVAQSDGGAVGRMHLARPAVAGQFVRPRGRGMCQTPQVCCRI